MFFGGIVIKGFRSISDPFCRPVGAVGQNIADPLPPGNPVKQPEKPPFLVCGTSFEIFIRQNPCLIKLDPEGQNLGG